MYIYFIFSTTRVHYLVTKNKPYDSFYGDLKNCDISNLVAKIDLKNDDWFLKLF